MRAKFRCSSVKNFEHGEHVSLYPSHRDEVNAVWTARPEPTGELQFKIDRPDQRGRFKPGAEYFVDLTPVEPTHASEYVFGRACDHGQRGGSQFCVMCLRSIADMCLRSIADRAESRLESARICIEELLELHEDDIDRPAISVATRFLSELAAELAAT